MRIVKVRALFGNSACQDILGASKLAGRELQNSDFYPLKCWMVGLKYQVTVCPEPNDPTQAEFVRLVKVRTTRPTVVFQPIGKWEKVSFGAVSAKAVPARRNQQLNCLLVNAQHLINESSSLTLQDANPESLRCSRALADNYKYLTSPRQLVEFSTPIDYDRICSTPRVLARFRKGRLDLFDELLVLPLAPLKLLEVALQTGCPKLFRKFIISSQMPPVNWAQAPTIRRHIHLLGLLPVEAKLMLFLASKQNSTGLESQICQGVPWKSLMREAMHYRHHSSTLNFLGFHLPCGMINFRPSSDPQVREDLARCAHQSSAGFNILSPTAVALLEAGSGLEESLKLCRTGEGTALKKFTLSHFAHLHPHLTSKDPGVWHAALSKDPWIVKLTQIPTTQEKTSNAQIASLELF